MRIYDFVDGLLVDDNPDLNSGGLPYQPPDGAYVTLGDHDQVAMAREQLQEINKQYKTEIKFLKEALDKPMMEEVKRLRTILLGIESKARLGQPITNAER